MWHILLLSLSSFASGSNNYDGFPNRAIETGPRCCSELRNSFGSHAGNVLVLRNTTEFTTQQSGKSGYWTQQEASLIPSCRITPTCAEDVSSAIKTLARSNCQFAIRGGGHMSWAGAANIQDGVTIDLSQMNTVIVNDDELVTRVGPGARWADVYSKLAPMNLSVVGGRVSDVGVAGLTLGGGNSFFAPRYGFACDGIGNFEVVLASGRIIDVNLHSNRDLFKALKGGNNNFGIVTRFDFVTFNQGEVWGGFIVHPYQTLPSQVQALQDFTSASGAGTDPYASVINAYIFGPTGPEAIANQYTYTKPQPYPQILQNFTNIQPQISNSMRVSDLLNITDEVGSGTPNGYRQLFGTATVANNVTIFTKILDIAEQVFRPIKNVTDFQSSVVMQPIPRTITSKGAENGGNVLGLDGSEDLVFLDLTIQWSFARDDLTINTAAESFLRQSIAFAKSQNLYNEFLYLNYALQSQDPIAGYGARNQEFLRRVARKYDRKGVFQRLVPGGYKLWRDEGEVTCC